MIDVLSEIAKSLRQFAQEQPLSLLLFLLGSVLMLLGLTRGFSVLVPDEHYRLVTLVFGALAILGSVLLSLRRPGSPPRHIGERLGALADLPAELDYDQLSRTQKTVLRAVEDETTGRRLVTMTRIESLLNIQPKELFYRLEQLRLLCFVDHEVLNPDAESPENAYRLSVGYAQQLGRESQPRSGPRMGSAAAPADHSARERMPPSSRR